MSRHISIQTHKFTRNADGDAGGILRPMPAPANATNVTLLSETVSAFTPETFELVTVITYELPTVQPVKMVEVAGKVVPVTGPAGSVVRFDGLGKQKIDNTPIRVQAKRWSVLPTIQELVGA